MAWFRRRVGRHQLGAAVTALPSAAARTAMPTAYVESFPTPRIELGFRDGSTALLLPGSAQSVALQAIASALTRRD